MRIYIYYYYIHHNYTHITTILFSQTVSDLVLGGGQRATQSDSWCNFWQIMVNNGGVMRCFFSNG